MNYQFLAIIFSVLLLVACNHEENVSISSSMPFTTNPLMEEEQVTPAVVVYGLTSVTNGFVIHSDKRKKWLITIASAVSSHPNALIETSAGQLLKADIVAIDETQNIAILTFKNSAIIEPFTLADQDHVNDELGEIGLIELAEQNVIGSLTSFVMKEEEAQLIVVQPSSMKQLLQQAQNKPLIWKERNEKSELLTQFSPIGTELSNKIEIYDKATFDYNPDALMIFVDRFQQQLNVYFQNGDQKEIKKLIASDDLLTQLEEIEESHVLGELTIKALSVNDHIYTVECETTVFEGEEQQSVRVIYKLIKQNGEWQIISVHFS